MKNIQLKQFAIGEKQPLAILSGPCVIENEDHAIRAAQTLQKICKELNISLVYKSSYDKANRSSIHSFRGVGLQEGLRILEKIKKELNLPVVTDVHSPEEAIAAGAVCDIIQIPAFL